MEGKNDCGWETSHSRKRPVNSSCSSNTVQSPEKPSKASNPSAYRGVHSGRQPYNRAVNQDNGTAAVDDTWGPKETGGSGYCRSRLVELFTKQKTQVASLMRTLETENLWLKHQANVYEEQIQLMTSKFEAIKGKLRQDSNLRRRTVSIVAESTDCAGQLMSENIKLSIALRRARLALVLGAASVVVAVAVVAVTFGRCSCH